MLEGDSTTRGLFMGVQVETGLSILSIFIKQKMYWLESTGDNKRFILFSHVSFAPYTQELAELGGLYLNQIETKDHGKREGWVFDGSLRAKIEEFITKETQDVASTGSEPITLEHIQDLLLELFDRVAVLEQKMGITE